VVDYCFLRVEKASRQPSPQGASANWGIGFIGGLGLSYEVNDSLLIHSDVRYRYNNMRLLSQQQ
jgi:hypothetical protein